MTDLRAGHCLSRGIPPCRLQSLGHIWRRGVSRPAAFSRGYEGDKRLLERGVACVSVRH